MIKIGIVGTGNIVGISHYHAQGLLRDGRAEIAAVYDTRHDGAAEWVREHNLAATVCRSYEQLIEMVDAVNICVPNVVHSEYALKAIEAGKHFLLEKPMAVTLEESARLAAAAESFAHVGMMGFVYRYANAVQRTKEIVEQRIGRVYTYTSWFGGKRLSDPSIALEWRMIRSRSGSGALGDFGSHLIDLADFVATQRYETIACQTGQFIRQRQNGGGLAEIENDDAAVFVAKGPNGLGSFTVSRVGLDDLMILVTGEGGMVQLSLRGEGSVTYWHKNLDGGYTGRVEDVTFAPQEPFAGWFDREMSGYLDAIEDPSRDYPSVAQGYYVERVLACAEQAYVRGEVGRI